MLHGTLRSSLSVHVIATKHVAEALVNLFARVGVPQEILTDQGTNFMSQLTDDGNI
jgi:hypothetical protein